MNAEMLYAYGGAALIALSLFVLVAIPHLLRKLVAFNVLSSGIFLILIGLGQRSGEPDPIPQALVLTGIVVAFASTALALTLMRRWFRMSGRFTLDSGIDTGIDTRLASEIDSGIDSPIDSGMDDPKTRSRDRSD